MSKPTSSETLHTCPDCGQGGFLAKGLKAHQGGKTCQARAKSKGGKSSTALVKAKPVTVASPAAKAAKPALLKEFNAARTHVANIQNLGRRTVHESILLGHALNQAKGALGIKRGGDKKSEESKTQSASLIPWQELVEQQTGLSHDTCQRCMLLATGAKKHIGILTASDVLKKPLNKLPAARRQEVVAALMKATDGQTFGDLMDAFGVTKAKKQHAPPKPTAASAAKRTENQQNETLPQEQLMEAAKADITTITEITTGEAFKSLNEDDLAAMENAVDALKAKVADELKLRRKAK